MRDRNAYASLREGLVGAWIPSVSGSGLLLPDLSGNGNNGALTNMGPEDWVSSQYGRALDFDGVNDRVGLGKALFNAQSFTATQWAYYAGSSATVSACFAQYAIGASGRLLLHYHNNDGTISFNVGGSAPNIQSPEILNSWYHVAVVRIGVNYTMYINGSYVGASSDSDVIYTGTATTIGGTISGLYWLGQVDDTRIYNRALSESEIKLLSQEPGVGFKRTRSVFDFGRKPAYLPPTPTDYRTVRVKQTEHASLREGLVGAWCPSIEGSGYTLPDLSGRGNNGVLTNMGPEDWVAGEYGRALDFDGVDDYVEIPYSPELSFGNGTTDLPFSVSFFVNSSGFIAGDFIGKNDSTTTQREWRIILSGSADQFLFVLYDANFSNRISAEISTVAIDDGNWHHVTCVYSGNRSNTGLNIYFDAVEQSVVRASAGAYVAMEAYTNPIWIGRVNIRYQAIKTDDIRIYNRALSEPEIKLLASRPGIGLRPQRRTMYYAPPTGARRRRILTSMP